MDFMAEKYKYNNNHILQKPELSPKRHYETEKNFTEKLPVNNDDSLRERHPLLPILQRLINITQLSRLLPGPEMKIINNVNDACTLLTKSIIYDSIINPVGSEYINNNNNSDIYELPDVKDNSDEDTEVPLFPDDPGFEIVTHAQESLYSLANKRFIADYEDITKDYASSMEQIIHRFFQTMLTLADDAEVPDYSYLMKDFDGAAVYIDDDDLQHARDYCVKMQRNREADTRLMQKEFTAENTLIRGRALVSAEKQRERYFKENYKINTSALCTTLGNNALFESRQMAQKQYENAMYNLYKYLNSSTETMLDVLDKRINEAAVKGQLALNGVSIFEKTPEPIPSAVDLDTNSTSGTENAISGAIDDNAKETAEASLDNFCCGGTGASAGNMGTSADAAEIYKKIRAFGYNHLAACAIMGNMMQESSLNPKSRSGLGYQGLCQWDPNNRWPSLVQWAGNRDPYDIGTQLDYMYYEATTQRYPSECSPAPMNSRATVKGLDNACIYGWLQYFEGALEQEESNRVNYARAYDEQFKNL